MKALLKGPLTPLAIMGADTPAAKHVFATWMGPLALFAAGNGLLELEGGIVIDSKNAALSSAAIPALAAGLKPRRATRCRSSPWRGPKRRSRPAWRGCRCRW